jgi:hypothetical protein
MRSICLLSGLAALLFVMPVAGQDTAPAPANAPAQTQASAAQAPADQSSPAAAQAAASAPAPTPLPSPSMTAPLSMAAPSRTFGAGPFGTLDIGGIVSGIGLVQSNHIPGDETDQWDISNAQIFLQKTTGWWQFYLQAGAYNLPSLGTPFTRTINALPDFYGAMPTAYLKLVKGNFNLEVGELPTLIGAEYTFTFQNMNIERGLLWNQETAISRGIQVSDTFFKKLTLTASWNDGFYSNSYNWISGEASYAINASNTLAFVAGGNFGQTSYSTTATPYLQNNGSIYNIIYTYSHGNWMINPYYQYTFVPEKANIGILNSGSTSGGALLVNYNFKHGVSLAFRPEYISSSGTGANPEDLNLLGYGAGSGAFSFTITPAYQKDGFFLRGDFSIVDAHDFTAGDAFGSAGLDGTQTRGVVEAGFIF